MPVKEYLIFVKGMLCFRKYSRTEFERICDDLELLYVEYTFEIKNLI